MDSSSVTSCAVAQTAEQPLADDAQDATAQEVGFDPHVRETTDRAGRAPGVKGRDDQVPGEGGLKHGFRRRAIADLPDKDRFGILTHQGPQAGRQVEAGGRMHLGLSDPVDGDLDRVLERHQAAGVSRSAHQFAETGVGGRRLAAARRSANQDGSGGLHEQLSQPVQNFCGKPQVVRVQEMTGRGKQPHNRALAVQGGKRTDSDFHLALAFPNPPLLRHVIAISQQLGKHLQAGNDIRGLAPRKRADRLQNTVQTPADLQPLRCRLEVKVAGVDFASSLQQPFDKFAGVAGIARSQLVQGCLDFFRLRTRTHGRNLGLVGTDRCSPVPSGYFPFGRKANNPVGTPKGLPPLLYMWVHIFFPSCTQRATVPYRQGFLPPVLSGGRGFLPPCTQRAQGILPPVLSGGKGSSPPVLRGGLGGCFPSSLPIIASHHRFPSVLPAHRDRSADRLDVEIAQRRGSWTRRRTVESSAAAAIWVFPSGANADEENVDMDTLTESLENTIVRIPDAEIFENMDSVMETLAAENRVAQRSRIRFGVKHPPLPPLSTGGELNERWWDEV